MPRAAANESPTCSTRVPAGSSADADAEGAAAGAEAGDAGATGAVGAAGAVAGLGGDGLEQATIRGSR